MKHNYLKHFTEIGLGTLLSMIIGVVTTPIITRLVNPTNYGKYSVFNMYTNIALMILCFGFDQVLVRYFFEKNDDTYKSYLLHRCLKIPILVTTFLFFFSIYIINTGRWEFELGKTAFLLLCICIYIQVIYRFSQLVLRLQYKTKLYSFLNVIQKIVFVSVAFLLLGIDTIDDSIALMCSTVAAFIICLQITIVIEKKIWFCPHKLYTGSRPTFKEMFFYGYPYIFSMGITTLFQTVDKICINMYCSYSDVGIYSSAMTLVNIFAIIQNSFNTLWMPIAVEHYSNNSEDKYFYQKGNQIITVIMFSFGITLILFKDIFVILLGEKYREAANLLPFLIFNPIMYTISETTVTGLVLMKKSIMQLLIAVIACVSNIIGNEILVPYLGTLGAAISTGISYIIFFSARTFFSNKCFHINFELKKFYLVTIVVSLYAAYNSFLGFNILSIIGYFVCLMILFLLYKDTIEEILSYTINVLFTTRKNKKY